MKCMNSEVGGQISIAEKPVKVISSYSYLSLNNEPEMIEYGCEMARKYGTGNHGPRLLCGNLEIHEIFE